MDPNLTNDQDLPATAASGKSRVKQRYETSPDVQRWLRDHAPKRPSEKPPFEPTFAAGLRDSDWILSSLTHFYQDDLIADVLYTVKPGKEATVYCCEADPATGVDLLAAKIYRPRMFRSLSNDAVYRESRSQYDVDGRRVRGGNRRRVASKNERGRAARISSWIEFEWETQKQLYAAGADVPRPWAQRGNAVLMEYIGDADGPAPHLQQVRIDPEEAQPLFDSLMRNVELWLRTHRIHGDLSAYNILYWEGQAIIIDFAQAVDPRHNPEVFPLLERDVERVYRYFARYGVEADPVAIAADMWFRYTRGKL